MYKHMNDREKGLFLNQEGFKGDSHEHTNLKQVTELGSKDPARREVASVSSKARTDDSSDIGRRSRFSGNQEYEQLYQTDGEVRGTRNKITRNYVEEIKANLGRNQTNFHESKEMLIRIRDKFRESIANL